ncbi:interleukin 2 receptor, gamma a [Hoplias malabaricus]|uniref:interleukin 2 receptor, gamma a n=1 Tax=Hoplias malabaricus TaxID=27720 RepID=UPI003463401D
MFALVSLLMFWTCSGSTANDNSISITCLVINLEYVNCSWDEGGVPQESYIFKSRFEADKALSECPDYLKVGEVAVGCRVLYNEMKSQRFEMFYALLSRADGTNVYEYSKRLLNEVKLDPPSNLSLEMKKPELWFYWNTTTRTKSQCKESQVRYKINNKDWQVEKANGAQNMFNLPFPSEQSVYEFQARVHMSVVCGESNHWSTWSESVTWRSLKNNNDTDSQNGSSLAPMVLYVVGGIVVLIVLTCLLLHSERMRVILVPVVPGPGKTLMDLIDNYDGNVERWLSISKEFQDGFKPNFAERPCPVREYKLLHQNSSDSEASLSTFTDVSSEYQPMHSYTSASTLSATPTQNPDAMPLETTQATPTEPMPVETTQAVPSAPSVL